MLVQTELAWAAGFFDGEGSVSCHTQTKRVGREVVGYLHLSIRQKEDEHELLSRFKSAVLEYGVIYQFEPGVWDYRIWGFEGVQFVIALLWKYLGSVKRMQYRSALQYYYSLQKEFPYIYNTGKQQGLGKYRRRVPS